MQSTSCLGQTVSENLKDYRVAGTDNWHSEILLK